MVHEEPYYLPIADEVELFDVAYDQRIPGPAEGPHGLRQDSLRRVHGLPPRPAGDEVSTRTGEEAEHRMPLITVACHEDLTASDLVGRYLLDTDGTRWVDGPLTRAVKSAPSATSMRSSKPARTPPSSSTRSPTTGACSRSRSSARWSRPPTASSSSSPTTRATRAR
jgi:hypothetical protein